LTASDADEVASEWSRFTTEVAPALPTDPPPARLGVRLGSGAVLAGRSLAVRASGLEPDEAYSLELAGIDVGSGQADQAGAVTDRITVRRSLADGVRTLRITGSTAERTGEARVMVLRNRALRGKLVRPRVRRGAVQRIV